MKELKAKAKVTQAMTRDGLTLENQATGEVENISSREVEADLPRRQAAPPINFWNVLTRPMTGTRPRKPQSRPRPPPPRGTLPRTGQPPGSN